MKKIMVLLLTTLALFSAHSSEVNIDKTHDHIATCYGNRNCYACKNCRYCKHCNAGGGSCGVCSSSGSLPVVRTTVPANTSSSQCKGTTKKGARCKRMVRGGGYCYQHK